MKKRAIKVKNLWRSVRNDARKLGYKIGRPRMPILKIDFLPPKDFDQMMRKKKDTTKELFFGRSARRTRRTIGFVQEYRCSIQVVGETVPNIYLIVVRDSARYGDRFVSEIISHEMAHIIELKLGLMYGLLARYYRPSAKG